MSYVCYTKSHLRTKVFSKFRKAMFKFRKWFLIVFSFVVSACQNNHYFLRQEVYQMYANIIYFWDLSSALDPILKFPEKQLGYYDVWQNIQCNGHYQKNMRMDLKKIAPALKTKTWKTDLVLNKKFQFLNIKILLIFSE